MTTEVTEPNPLVSMHMGITIPGPQDYSSIRVDVDFRDINTAYDIEPQLEKCAAIARQVAEGVAVSLAEQVATASGLNVEGLGLAAKFEDFKKRMTAWGKTVNEKIGLEKE